MRDWGLYGNGVYVLGVKGLSYLRRIGYEIGDSERAGKEIDKNYLFVWHSLDVNDLVISAVLLKKTEQTGEVVYSFTSFTHERELKRIPFKASLNDKHKEDKTVELVPDALLNFSTASESGSKEICVLLEHDRGTEYQQAFCKKIRAYAAWLKSESYEELSSAKRVIVAFTTFVGEERLEQMRIWTKKQLDSTKEPEGVRQLFFFASLTKPIDPQQVWLQPCWYGLSGDEQDREAISLLGS